METTHHTFYKSEDFEKAFLLLASNHILDTVEWNERGDVATFVFENEEECLQTLDQHKRRKLKINSTDVLVSYRELKNELFNR